MDSSSSLVALVQPVASGSPPARWRSLAWTRSHALGVLLVLSVGAFNVFYHLAGARIDDMDEARYGVAAYEMLQTHHWVVTTYGGRPETWNLKPPLGYWLLSLSFALLGPSALALRLPSALCALATIALLMTFCRRHLGDRTALLAGAILVTCFGFFSHHGARSGDLDSALTLLLVAAGTLVPALAPSAWRWLALWAIFTAGFLLKSFAVAPMMAVVALYLLTSGDWRRVHRAACAGGALFFATGVGLWAAARWIADGSPYFLEMVVSDEVVARCLHQVDAGGSRRIDYLPALLDRFAPWTELLVVAIVLAGVAGGWRRLGSTFGIDTGAAGRPRIGLLLALWAGLPLLVFSLAKTHHHWYLDPTYPVLAAIAAQAMLWLVEQAPRHRREALALLVVLLPLVGCEARVLARIIGRDRLPRSQQLLLSLRDHRAELGPELRVAGPLAHSERFILEAIDGYHLVEEPAQRPARVALATAPLPHGHTS